MVVLLIMMIIMPKGSDALVISVLALVSLIITYHRTYDFFVLVVVAALFAEWNTLGLQLKTGIDKVLTGFYIVLMIAINYVLRIFSEAQPSLICVGTLYYAFTLCILYLGIRRITNK